MRPKKSREAIRLELAKKKYFKLERDLKKAREALSLAYSKYDDRIRSEHMAEKYGL